METIKTVQWTECEELFTVSARQHFGKTRSAHPKNFVEFINAYSMIPLKSMTTFVEKIIERNDLSDCTQWAEMFEDSCLLSLDGEDPAVLSIVDRYLRQLNTGAQVPALWCYVDDEKKVVVHFVCRKGWFAELYVLSDEENSALHLVDGISGLYFVTVLFTPDLTHYSSAANMRGGVCLHDYLPRQKYDCLSKGGKKHLNGHSYVHKGRSDDGDNL